MGFKVIEELIVSKVCQAVWPVRDEVVDPADEIYTVDVAVVPLVH